MLACADVKGNPQRDSSVPVNPQEKSHNMKKTCVIHIGSSKSGSTTIQDVLYELRGTLSKLGVEYPSSILWRGDRSHNMLGIYMWNDFYESFKVKTFDQIIGELFDEIELYSRAIISSELLEKAILYGNRDNLVQFNSRLREAGFDIQILYVIRRQDFFLESLFKHCISEPYTRYAGTAAAFIDKHASRLFYANYAHKWRHSPGVSSMEIFPFVEGSVSQSIEAILLHLGVPLDVLRANPVRRLNRSLEGAGLRLKHWLNSRSDDIALHHRYVSTVSESVAFHSGPRTTLFSPSDGEKFEPLGVGELEDCLELLKTVDPELAGVLRSL